MNTTSPHLDPVWLRQKYETEGLSTYEIGAIVGRDPKGVYTQLRKFNIPTRPRGLNLADKDNYMRRPGAVPPFLGKTHTAETRAVLRRKASCPKPYLRGKANGMSGRYGVANPNYKDGECPERQRLYARSEWKEIVRAVDDRDGRRCCRCGAPKERGGRRFCTHHIRSWTKCPEERFNLDNLVTLCRECHAWVHSPANTERLFRG